MKQILLVDDHQVVRDGIKLFLNANPEFKISGEAQNGVEAMKLLSENSYDLIISDVNMPEMDGMELVEKIREEDSNQPILILTMMGDSIHIKKLLSMGINGFIIKNSPKDEIIKAINQILSGEDYYSKEVMNAIIGSISKKKPIQRLTYEVSLTEREKEVLQLICQEMSNQEIADKLFISTRTVESHKRKLLEKTGCKNIAGLVLYAIEKDYLQ